MVGPKWDNMEFWESIAFIYICVGVSGFCGWFGSLKICETQTR